VQLTAAHFEEQKMLNVGLALEKASTAAGMVANVERL
jgi:hypothetical protein